MKVLSLYRDRMLAYLGLYVKRSILVVLISIEDKVEVTMADKYSSFKEIMSWSFS